MDGFWGEMEREFNGELTTLTPMSMKSFFSRSYRVNEHRSGEVAIRKYHGDMCQMRSNTGDCSLSAVMLVFVQDDLTAMLPLTSVGQ